MLETHDQYWGIGVFSLRCNANFFYVDLSYYKERQYFVIPFIADMGIFIIAYFVLLCPPHSMLHILFVETATGNYSLKYVFPKKLNSSGVKVLSCLILYF